MDTDLTLAAAYTVKRLAVGRPLFPFTGMPQAKNPSLEKLSYKVSGQAYCITDEKEIKPATISTY